MTNNHNVELDTAGFNSQLLRLTCYTCNETLIKAPYMNWNQWNDAVIDFNLNHLSKIIEDHLAELIRRKNDRKV